VNKPRLLDLFSGAGGAAMGYYRAGFDVVGVDIKPMPRYPFEFYQADALEYCAAHGREFDVIHASPPCQFYSEMTPEASRANHPDLIAAMRQTLENANKPFIIENVAGAKHILHNPLKLCGSMFSLGVRRHRYFEMSPITFYFTLSCNHSGKPVYLNGCGHTRRGEKKIKSVKLASVAMGIDWMTFDELREAIPPAYTEWIGKQLMEKMK